MNKQMSDKTLWKFLEDLKHKKEEPKEEKVGKNFKIQVVLGTHIKRWFSGTKPEVAGPKFSFPESRRHDWPEQSIETIVAMQKHSRFDT